MATNELTVSNWAELNEILFADTWDPAIRRFRSTFAYRGMASVGYELTNGLARLGTPYPKLEQNLLKQFKKYAHRHFVERDTEWHWLSVAQHHGLPTRLLDWTYSPLIALHFATCEVDRYDMDGVVWKVNYSQVHDLLQSEQTEALTKLGARIFNIDALVESIPSLQALDHRRAPNYEIAVFFEPPAMDDRIINQFAYFSAISDPFLSMNAWLDASHVKAHVDARNEGNEVNLRELDSAFGFGSAGQLTKPALCGRLDDLQRLGEPG